MNDLETRLRQTMHAVADSTTIPPVPRTAPARVPLRHRMGKRVTALIAVGGLSVIGLGTAAATGVLTPGADKAFSDWDNVNPRDAVLVARLPGPGDTVVAAYEAPDHSNGQTCIAFIVFHDAAYGDHGIGGACSRVTQDDLAFGRSGGSLSQIELPGHEGFAVFVTSAGDAVSAEINYNSAWHPAVVADGYILGWAPDAQWATATLIARGASGTVIGEINNYGSNNPQLVTP